MHRRPARWLLLAPLLLLVGCAGPGATAAPLTAEPPATALPLPVPTATPAPPLPGAFPTPAAGQSSVYVVDYDRTIRVVDPRTGSVTGDLPVGRGALPVFSPDGSRLYVTHSGESSDATRARLDVFEVATGRRLASVDGLELMTYKIWGPPIIAPARDGRTVYLLGRRITSRPGEAGRDSCWIYAVDLGAQQLSPETIPLPTCRVAPLVLSADGRTLYSGPWLVDLTTQPATVHENPDLGKRAVAQSADGRWLYALDRRGTLAVWDTDARRVVWTVPGAVAAYHSAVFLSQPALQLSHDGTRLFVAVDGSERDDQFFQSIVVLDSATGQRVEAFRSERPFNAFAVSPDGREYYLVTRSLRAPGALEVALEIWDRATGTRRASVPEIGAAAGPVLAPLPP